MSVDVGLHTHTEFTAASNIFPDRYCWLDMFSERPTGKSTRLDMSLEGPADRYTGAEIFPARPAGADSFLGELPRCNCMRAASK